MLLLLDLFLTLQKSTVLLVSLPADAGVVTVNWENEDIFPLSKESFICRIRWSIAGAYGGVSFDLASHPEPLTLY